VIPGQSEYYDLENVELHKGQRTDLGLSPGHVIYVSISYLTFPEA
jgi:hypothetical protein